MLLLFVNPHVNPHTNLVSHFVSPNALNMWYKRVKYDTIAG